MTFDQIVQRTMDRMNLTSDEARTRIGESVNERYDWLCTSMGLQTSIQDVATATTTIGSNLLTFGPSPLKVQKINSLFNQAYAEPNELYEVSVPEIEAMQSATDPAQYYAVYRMYADRVTVKLNVTPATAYELSANVIADKATLSGADVPTFAKAYHNILFYGAMATEYDKMENDEKAAEFEQKFENRCGELRLFIAKSVYKDIHQGKMGPGFYVGSPLV